MCRRIDGWQSPNFDSCSPFDDYDAALASYRDSLGLVEQAAYAAPNSGRVTLLDAGRAALELADAAQAEYIDQVEVGRRVAGQLRVAFQVADAVGSTDRLTAAGAELIAPPTPTPWESITARLLDRDGVQLTLFQELADRRSSGLRGSGRDRVWLRSLSARRQQGLFGVKSASTGDLSFAGFVFWRGSVSPWITSAKLRVIHRFDLHAGIGGGCIRIQL